MEMTWKNTKPHTKYNNTRAECDGIVFDSKGEMRRYCFLKTMMAAGLVKDLRLQVRYELIPPITHEEEVELKTKKKTVTKTDQLGIYYTADFVYTKTETGEEVVEDFKGNRKVISADVPLRFKLFYWKYGKKVRVVTTPNEQI